MATTQQQRREQTPLAPSPPYPDPNNPPVAIASQQHYHGDPEDKPDDGSSRFEFTDRKIRMAFIRKVYGILTVQLLITFGFVAVFVFVDEVKTWSQANPGYLYGAIGVSFVLVIAMACCEGVRRKFPGNLICLLVFTIAESFLVGTFSSYFDTYSVILAIGITVIICFALTVFAFQTKWDLTGMGTGLGIVLLIFFLFGLLTIFLPRSQFPILHIVYAGIGTLLFSIYLIYDTQLMLGGKHKYALSPEEYIFAALNLYLDIINIFIYILSIVGGSRN